MHGEERQALPDPSNVTMLQMPGTTIHLAALSQDYCHMTMECDVMLTPHQPAVHMGMLQVKWV